MSNFSCDEASFRPRIDSGKLDSGTQELKLEDLRHVALIRTPTDAPSPRPQLTTHKQDASNLIQLSLDQTLNLTVTAKPTPAAPTSQLSLTNHEDLMDFSNITYQVDRLVLNF